MAPTTPCYRHPRRVWMVACADCTAWHMAVALARRAELVSVAATARTADVASSAPTATDVAPVALRLVA